MRKLTIFFYLISFLLYCEVSFSISPDSTKNSKDNLFKSCSYVPKAIDILNQVNGLTLTKKVSCESQTKEQVRSYILSELRNKLKPMQMEYEGLFFQSFSFFPANLNYKQTLVNLYLDQIAGYYDAHRDVFVMAEWIPVEAQKPVIFHELVHAIQDRQFDIEKIIDPRKQSSDLQMAHSALLEGDATAHMFKSLSFLSGVEVDLAKLSDSEIDKILAEKLGIIETDLLIAETKKTDLYALQKILTFPYEFGFKFIAKILREDGEGGLSRVWQKMPRSSEEILHIDLFKKKEKDFIYISNKKALEVLSIKNPKILFSDSYGEFFIKTWLESVGLQDLQASRAAAGWAGDLLLLLDEDARDGMESRQRKSLTWLITWDSSRDADEFFGAVSPRLDVLGKSPLVEGFSLQRKKDYTILTAILK